MTIYVLSLLIGFFFLGLLVRNSVYKNLCALCLSVSLTWLVLLSGYWLNSSGDPVLLGLLLGGSTVGGIYYLSAKTDKKYQIFKFPLLISFFWVAYQLIVGLSAVLLQEVLFLLGLWVFFIIVFIFYTNQKWQNLGKRIIECCKNW